MSEKWGEWLWKDFLTHKGLILTFALAENKSLLIGSRWLSYIAGSNVSIF
jgi:hypothetical protein